MVVLCNHMLWRPLSQASENAWLGAPFSQLGNSETIGPSEYQVGCEGRQALLRVKHDL